MGPTIRRQVQNPSASLPPLRGGGGGHQLDEATILSALDNLFAIYYPPSPTTIPKSVLLEATAQPYKLPAITRLTAAASLQVPDSGYSSPGYISEDEDEEADGNNDGVDHEAHLELLRADEFERSFATRWLEKFMIRAEDDGDEVLEGVFETDESRASVVERAADLLTVLLNPEQVFPQTKLPADRSEEDGLGGEDGEEDVFCRELKFTLAQELRQPAEGDGSLTIKINDGLAGSTSADHTDVGVQTWGASIVMCQMMCDLPSRFGLSRENLGEAPRIVELGAGTGVVSLVLGQLLPRHLGVKDPIVVATDYHPLVMTNLRRNIAMNEDSSTQAVDVHACTLDWAQPDLLRQEQDWPTKRMGGYEGNADMLVATDVVYAKEHAALLRDCAARLLAPGGTFWLLQTVRSNGRFGEYEDAVESAFPVAQLGEEVGGVKRLKILEAERLEKRRGVGRGDETFYRLFRIGWA